MTQTGNLIFLEGNICTINLNAVFLHIYFFAFSEPEAVGGNPLVAGFQDDVDEEEIFVTRTISSNEDLPASLQQEDNVSQDSISIPATKKEIKDDWLLPGKTRRSSPEGREEADDLPEVNHIPDVSETTSDKSEKPKKIKVKVLFLLTFKLNRAKFPMSTKYHLEKIYSSFYLYFMALVFIPVV